MKVKLEKYVGKVVEIIYTNKQNSFTQRRVKVVSVEAGMIRAFCLECMAPRTFLLESVLAVQPAGVNASMKRAR